MIYPFRTYVSIKYTLNSSVSPPPPTVSFPSHFFGWDGRSFTFLTIRTASDGQSPYFDQSCLLSGNYKMTCLWHREKFWYERRRELYSKTVNDWTLIGKKEDYSVVKGRWIILFRGGGDIITFLWTKTVFSVYFPLKDFLRIEDEYLFSFGH